MHRNGGYEYVVKVQVVIYRLSLSLYVSCKSKCESRRVSQLCGCCMDQKQQAGSSKRHECDTRDWCRRATRRGGEWARQLGKAGRRRGRPGARAAAGLLGTCVSTSAANTQQHTGRNADIAVSFTTSTYTDSHSRLQLAHYSPSERPSHSVADRHRIYRRRRTCRRRRATFPPSPAHLTFHAMSSGSSRPTSVRGLYSEH